MPTQKSFKPHEFVFVTEQSDSVECGAHTYIGEVMSVGIPMHTLMVRRVPGHPRTLVQLPVGKLQHLRKDQRPLHVHYARVAGIGQFPVDMLRYDQCVPVNFKLVPDSWGKHTKPEIDLSFGFGNALVVARAVRRGEPWTVGRWNSFLWSIKPINAEKL